MDDFKLTTGQIVSLKAFHKLQRDRKKADRVKAIVLLGKGWTVAQTADVLLVDETTIRTWLEKYVKGGENELITLCYTGKQSLLTDAQQKELAKHLEDNTYIDSKAIAEHIKKTYKIKYSQSGLKDLLHRMDFVYKKPKHVPGKLDPEKQAEFVNEYEKLRENKGENDPIYFCDACHPQHNSIPAYGWIKKGTDKELKSNGGRKRVNINGAVDIETLDIVTDFAKSVNGESSLRLFRKLEAKHPDAKEIHVILDNASYYKSIWLKEQLGETKIRFHYLPGYSPNLNLIERLWKFFKKKILYNKYYKKFDTFLDACKGFFRCRKKWREELRTLLAENFHLYQNEANS
jgi:transposase